MSRWLVGSFVITIAAWIAWGAVFMNGPVFPEKMPIHWDINMQPDGWAPGSTAAWWLMLFPATITILTGLCVLLPKLAPGSLHDDSTRSRFDFALFALNLFALILAVLVFIGMQSGDLPVRWFLANLFLLFGALGWSMIGLKPNPWIGVRLPWTTNNEAVWNRTHAFTAQVWIATAAFGVGAIIAGAPPLACLVGFFIAVFTPIVASAFFALAARKN